MYFFTPFYQFFNILTSSYKLQIQLIRGVQICGLFCSLPWSDCSPEVVPPCHHIAPGPWRSLVMSAHIWTPWWRRRLQCNPTVCRPRERSPDWSRHHRLAGRWPWCSPPTGHSRPPAWWWRAWVWRRRRANSWEERCSRGCCSSSAQTPLRQLSSYRFLSSCEIFLFWVKLNYN